MKEAEPDDVTDGGGGPGPGLQLLVERSAWREDRLGEQSLQGPNDEGHLGGPKELGVLLHVEQGDAWRL